MDQEQNTARTFCIDLLILIACLATMAAMAFGVSAWEALQREEFDASVFGLSYKYADEVPLMEIYLWCGREDGDPNAPPEGMTPLGDTQGNIRSFTLRMLRDKVTVHNLAWDGYSETQDGTETYWMPVFTIKNKLGGKVRVAYEYKGLGALLYSTDDLRVPADDWDGWLYKKLRKLEIGLPPESVHRMNVDVFTDHASVGELDEKMTVSIPFDPFRGGLTDWTEEMFYDVPRETGGFFRSVSVRARRLCGDHPAEGGGAFAGVRLRSGHTEQGDCRGIAAHRILYAVAERGWCVHCRAAQVYGGQRRIERRLL